METKPVGDGNMPSDVTEINDNVCISSDPAVSNGETTTVTPHQIHQKESVVKEVENKLETVEFYSSTTVPISNKQNGSNNCTEKLAVNRYTEQTPMPSNLHTDTFDSCVQMKIEPDANLESVSISTSKPPENPSQFVPVINIKSEPVEDGVFLLKEEGDVPAVHMSYRQSINDESRDGGAESDDSSSVVFSDNHDNVSVDEDECNKKDKRNGPSFIPVEKVRTRGELLPEDLPPLEDLRITIAEDEKLLVLGTVSSFVGTLVVIQSAPDTPALNEDTVLFYEDRNVFGKVFEIFGPVSCPFYSVRFNSEDDIKSKVKITDVVYCAPNVEEITQFVFIDQLKKLKGSDASWKDNNEPPDKYIDYSDDETEKKDKSKRKEDRQKNKDNDEVDNIKNRKKELSFDTLPIAGDGIHSNQHTRGRKKKYRMNYDRDQPHPDSHVSHQNHEWNCWPSRGQIPQRPPTPRCAGQNPFIAPANFNPPSRDQGNMRFSWNLQNQGHGVSRNPQPTQSFNPRHSFPYPGQCPMGQTLMNNSRSMFFNNSNQEYANQNVFESNPQMNNFSNVPNAPIVDSRYIQNQQLDQNSQFNNPYHNGMSRQ